MDGYGEAIISKEDFMAKVKSRYEGWWSQPGQGGDEDEIERRD